MLMEVSAYRSEVRGERLGSFEKVHGASGVWSGMHGPSGMDSRPGCKAKSR